MNSRIWFNKNILLPISDFVRNRNLRGTLEMLNKSEFWPVEQLEKYQLTRLNEVLSFARRNVPYYAETLSGMGNGPITSLNDLQRIPLLTKEQIRNNYPQRITKNPLPPNGWRYHKTGGSTTGEPLITIEDDSASDMGRGCFYRAWSWMGWSPGAPALKIWGRPLGNLNIKQRVIKSISEGFMNMPLFNAFQMDDNLFDSITHNIMERKVQFIYGYASAIDEYANYILKNGIEINSIQGIMATAEVLYPAMRENITRAFKAPVFNGYACGEINGVAYQKHQDDGRMVISMERAIVEIVDERGRRVPDGEPGLIAITDLHKFIMPLIRYINGDEGIISRDPLSGLPRLDDVLGRTCDIIDGVNGKNIHSYFFARFFSDLDWSHFGLKRFQIVQNQVDALDIYLNIDVVPPDSEVERLRTRLREFVGNMYINVHWNKNVEISRSGKLRWTINNLRVKRR